MPNPFDIVGVVKGAFGAAKDVIDELNTSGEEKLEAQRKLVEIERNYQLEAMKLDVQLAAAQADVIKTEAQSQSWLTRNWRPITMLSFVFFVGVIIFTGGYVNGREIDKSFVLYILEIIKYGISAYAIGRSGEKIAPAIAEIFAKKEK